MKPLGGRTLNEPEETRDVHRLLREPWQINWRAIKAIFAIMASLATVIAVSYPFWPSVRIEAVADDLVNNPLYAKFQFQNIGRLDIENVVIACSVKSGSRTINTSGVLVVEPTGKRGQILARLGASSAPVVRSCGPPFSNSFIHPASISIDVAWRSMSIGHQFFISQQAPDGKCCLMVPESDPVAR